MGITYADSRDIDKLKAAADIIEEVSDLVTYLGFCKPGTENETSPQWSILKIVADGTEYPIVTTNKWAEGLCSYNLSWSERATYSYQYKGF